MIDFLWHIHSPADSILVGDFPYYVWASSQLLHRIQVGHSAQQTLEYGCGPGIGKGWDLRIFNELTSFYRLIEF